jgi:general secretion pathway protein J
MTGSSKHGMRAMRGFTLVEVLVVVALLSVVMLALGASMRTIAQTEERVDARLRQADEMRVTANFLSSILGRISPRKSDTPTQAGTSLYLFAPAPQSLAWIGVMPARYGAGGRYFFKLALEPQGGERALVLRYLPWAEVAAFPDWSRAETRVLAPHVDRLALEYGDDIEGQPSWVSQWPYADRLPERVRIALSGSFGEWPYLVIALRQLPASDNGRGGFSLGPE